MSALRRAAAEVGNFKNRAVPIAQAPAGHKCRGNATKSGWTKPALLDQKKAMTASPASPRPPRSSLKALLPLVPFALRYRGRMFLALVALVIAAGTTLAIPLAVRRMIDFGFSSEGAGLIDKYFGMMIVVVTLLAGASASRYYLVMTLGERVVADIRTAVFAHLTKLNAGFYDGVKSGELVSRLSADTTQLKSAFGASASVALRNLVLFLGAGGMMVYTSPRLAGLVALAIPLIVLPLVASGRSVRDRARTAQDRLADASAYATEAIGAMRIMQAFVAEALTMKRFSDAAEDAYETARIATRARSLLTGIGIALVFSSVVGILWYGAQDVLAGRLSPGTLSQFVLFAVFAAGGLGELSQVWGEISAAAGAASRLAELLAIVPAIRAPETPRPLPSPSPGTVEFRNVSFAYPSRPDEPVLGGVSFSVKKGERVAIVGPSGAGKSTIMQLVLRFYDATDGTVLIDGVPVTAAEPSAVRDRIAYVPQDSVIFGASIADNIRFGRPEASDQAVKAAAERAIVDAFVTAWPEGYGTRVGERGITLSGGQRQRLAIARAILKDAPILLLDEATSALDAESETLVQAALDRLMEGRTTIVIAHRLSTIVTADRILVMEHGRIVEEGDHATLVAKGGLYARLAALQFETGI